MRRKRRIWTKQEEAQLRLLYPDTRSDELAHLFNRPLHHVYGKAKRMNLEKSDAFLNSSASGRIVKGSHLGIKTQFKTGLTPWNKGKKIDLGGQAIETQFKPGHRPSNWLPLGSERANSGGYLRRKITDTGYPPKDWKSVHVILWEESHGPIPPDHVIWFRDGNKSNITLDNLELITHSELACRNSIHRFPPELKRAIRASSKLKRAIREQSNEKQD